MDELVTELIAFAVIAAATNTIGTFVTVKILSLRLDEVIQDIAMLWRNARRTENRIDKLYDKANDGK